MIYIASVAEKYLLGEEQGMPHLARRHTSSCQACTMWQTRRTVRRDRGSSQLFPQTLRFRLGNGWGRRKLYGLEKPKRSSHSKKETPFKASFRHQFWSVDVRYIEKHHIPDHEGPVYLISILENYSRAELESPVSPTQNQWDYLEVLFAAFSTYTPGGFASTRR